MSFRIIYSFLSRRMLLKLQTSSTKSTMSPETKEDKLSVHEAAFGDAQSGLQVNTVIIHQKPTKTPFKRFLASWIIFRYLLFFFFTLIFFKISYLKSIIELFKSNNWIRLIVDFSRPLMKLLGSYALRLPFSTLNWFKHFTFRLRRGLNVFFFFNRSFWSRKNHNQYGPWGLLMSTRYSLVHVGWW